MTKKNLYWSGLSVLIAALLGAKKSFAEEIMESKWFYGLDVTSPGVTLRRIDERFAFLVDVGFDISGYFYSAEETSSGNEKVDATAGLEEMNLLFRYNAIKIGKDLDLHANIGTTLRDFYYTGAGISFMKDLGEKNFVYLDADIAYFGAGKKFKSYHWAYATNDRIYGGFSRRF